MASATIRDTQVLVPKCCVGELGKLEEAFARK